MIKLIARHLVKYSGEWRLYINTAMLAHSPRRVGEVLEVTIRLDAESREIEMPDLFVQALAGHDAARSVFEGLPASRKLEIVRYLARLKSEEALIRNVDRAVQFLLGQGRFIGRDKP